MNLKDALLKHANDDPGLKKGLECFYDHLIKMPYDMNTLELTPYALVKILYKSTKDDFATRYILNSLSRSSPKVLVSHYFYENAFTGEVEELEEKYIYYALKNKKNRCPFDDVSNEVFLENVNVVYTINEKFLNDT